ncbi:hypothetical protein KR51_00029710 [Rubidibacter lacunae KORDI 51-2]|uniref:Uncharacterized protein n=1 Tax=Rubidibacter lacunae KORDI 51-2 TaxID=582515 RepID=U5DL28_9CHRO|nr:hypothetical protein [Rubidibacter lacunae]ERN40430.1 hypothetical protein KR51_00029710 [Rubidibacter lacunae KORDI 51-2]
MFESFANDLASGFGEFDSNSSLVIFIAAGVGGLVGILLSAMVFALSGQSPQRQERETFLHENLHDIYRNTLFAIAETIGTDSRAGDRAQKVRSTSAWLSLLLAYHPNPRDKHYKTLTQKLPLVDVQRQKPFFEELRELTIDLVRSQR